MKCNHYLHGFRASAENSTYLPRMIEQVRPVTLVPRPHPPCMIEQVCPVTLVPRPHPPRMIEQVRPVTLVPRPHPPRIIEQVRPVTLVPRPHPPSTLSEFPFCSFARLLPFFFEFPCFTFSRRSSLLSMTVGCSDRLPG